MQIITLGKQINDSDLSLQHLSLSELTQKHLSHTDYVVVSGGDGMLRRSVAELSKFTDVPPIIFNPIGSFNVIAKLHGITPIEQILQKIKNNVSLDTIPQKYYRLNNEIFLFSAGNMGDLHHIFLSESLRFGWIKKGVLKYLLAFLFLFPMHLIMTPFMLASKNRFFIFTPLGVIKKFGSFYGKVPHHLSINLDNDYNFIELDGDIVLIKDATIKIEHDGEIELVTG